MSFAVSGARVSLVPIAESDVTERYLGWLRDPDVTKGLATSNYSREELLTYVRARVADENVRMWKIVENASGEHIGNVKLEPIDWVKKQATLGVLIGEKERWGKGLGSEAVALACQEAVGRLGLKKVALGLKEDNLGALKSYIKIGFKEISRANQLIWMEWQPFEAPL